MDLPAVAIDDGDTLPGVIHQERLARAVGLPHDQIELTRPGAVRMTKPTLLHAVWRHGLRACPRKKPLKNNVLGTRKCDFTLSHFQETRILTRDRDFPEFLKNI